MNKQEYYLSICNEANVGESYVAYAIVSLVRRLDCLKAKIRQKFVRETPYVGKRLRR